MISKEPNRCKSESGAVLVIVSLCMLALMMITALAIDVGSIYRERRFLQTVADSAALAGAQELPVDVDGARSKAVEYASRCIADIDEYDVYVEVSSTLAPNDTIEVKAINPTAELYFARVIGLSHTEVAASARAMVASPMSVYNIVPWGIFVSDNISLEEYLQPGEPQTLKFGAGEGNGAGQGNGADEGDGAGEGNGAGARWGGNFGILDLDGGPGGEAGDYENWIINGYPGPLSVGDTISTKPGNMAGPTLAIDKRVEVWDDFDELVTYQDGNIIELARSDDQVVVVPLVHPVEDLHGRTEVEIVAFAPFILTEEPQGPSGQRDIIGRFIHHALIVNEGEYKAVEDVGLKIIRLID
ncbi:TadE/TadG family type IV pilus assembly protein [Desulfoglaeba alkanexedens]|uniref:Putative Flp pilus-assembly TadG-like N-terminal domain-containing protein n=1 Tax=Desulfoglaeba alkanexedens ALDC TaxID=980445 RepID=A0A4P8L4P9_9BACT|nr:Tad domain-containing protein [Desulfoglaeba alkanexedens]QCQ22967.1 hypothetical protein FDQ92_12790 [Desulfoglaeba alkanexedens ALDC]